MRSAAVCPSAGRSSAPSALPRTRLGSNTALSAGQCDPRRCAHLLAAVRHLPHCQELAWAQTPLCPPGNAIRGGVPICWPQFGTFRTAKNSPGLKHGFVRQSTLWKVEEQDTDVVSLRLVPDEEMLKKWP